MQQPPQPSQRRDRDAAGWLGTTNGSPQRRLIPTRRHWGLRCAPSPATLAATRAFAGFFAALVIAAASVGARAAESTPLTIDSVVLRPMTEAQAPARQTGVIEAILVAEGQRVDADELLLHLDAETAALAVSRAEVERDQARAKAENTLQIEYAAKALEVAEAELARSQESITKFPKSISRSQLDVERLTVEKLQLERRQAEHDQRLAQFDFQVKENALAVAQRELELHNIRAPFAGVVTLIRARAGEWVEPGTPVLRLIAVDRLRAEGFADAASVSIADVGRSVAFRTADDAPTAHAGVIRFVSPEIDPVTRQVRVWAEIDNSKLQLRPGEQGRLEIGDQ